MHTQHVSHCLGDILNSNTTKTKDKFLSCVLLMITWSRSVRDLNSSSTEPCLLPGCWKYLEQSVSWFPVLPWVVYEIHQCLELSPCSDIQYKPLSVSCDYTRTSGYTRQLWHSHSNKEPSHIHSDDSSSPNFTHRPCYTVTHIMCLCAGDMTPFNVL